MAMTALAAKNIRDMHAKWAIPEPPSYGALISEKGTPVPRVYYRLLVEALDLFEDTIEDEDAFRYIKTTGAGGVVSHRKLSYTPFDAFRGIATLSVPRKIDAKAIVRRIFAGYAAFEANHALRDTLDGQCDTYRLIYGSHHSEDVGESDSSSVVETDLEGRTYDTFQIVDATYKSGYWGIAPRWCYSARMSFYDTKTDTAWLVSRSIDSESLHEAEGFASVDGHAKAVRGTLGLHVFRVRKAVEQGQVGHMDSNSPHTTYELTILACGNPRGRVPAWAYNFAGSTQATIVGPFARWIEGGGAEEYFASG